MGQVAGCAGDCHRERTRCCRTAGPESRRAGRAGGVRGVSVAYMDDVKRAADEYNRIGEQSAKAGIQQGLHNEDFELTTVDGKRTYDLLLDLLDPKLVKFQFQVCTIDRGYDAAEYFTKYPGRFISMHVQGWSAQTKGLCGTGHSGLEEDFCRGENGGRKNYLVEMNLEMMKPSVPYLRKLNV